MEVDLQDHARLLASGLAEVQERTRKGQLSVQKKQVSLLEQDDRDGDAEDEEEYSLRKRLASCRGRVEELLDEQEYQASKESRGHVVALDEGSRKRVRSLLLHQNERSFERMRQHRDLERLDEVAYEQDGFGKNMPLPISAEAESIEWLSSSLLSLQHLTGVTLTSVHRKRLPSMLQTSWKLKGYASKATGDEEEEKGCQVESDLRFEATFKVDEKASAVSELALELSSVTRIELGEIVDYCESHNCFRTFFRAFAQYAELFHARRDLYHLMQQSFPHIVRVRHSLPKQMPFRFNAQLLEIGHENVVNNKLRKAWLVWEPWFTFQNVGGDQKKKRGRETSSLRTRIELWRMDQEGKLARDNEFEALVKLFGIADALFQLIQAINSLKSR